LVGEASLPTDVFINCPYDPDYARTFEALIFAVHALGFRARAAREVDDAADVRLEKIFRIIRECRYGIHDISKADLDKKTKLARFNMPLELGIWLGAKKFGDEEQERKATLVLDTMAFRYRDFISDLAGIDPHAHGGVPTQAVREVRDWLATASRRKLPSANQVADLHERFVADLPALAGRDGFDLNSIPYVDFIYFVTEWLAFDAVA